jgi:opacity protein-like surface antigen
MITAIAKSNLGIIFKNISIAAVLVFGLAQTAQADQTNNHQDLYLACNPAIDQGSNLNCSFNPQPIEIKQGSDTQIAQGTRGRRRKSKVDGYYGGFSGGIGFASGDSATDSDRESFGEDYSAEYTNSFDGSLFGGIKFSKNLSADLEFFLALGGLDTEDTENFLSDNNVTANVDGDFSAFALYANPRFELPLTKDDKLSLYISPGIGLSQTNANASIEDASGEGVQVSNVEVDESGTGISFQIKGGAEYQISDTMDIFAQARYVTLPTGGDLESIKIFGIDGGLKFNF